MKNLQSQLKSLFFKNKNNINKKHNHTVKLKINTKSTLSPLVKPFDPAPFNLADLIKHHST